MQIVKEPTHSVSFGGSTIAAQLINLRRVGAIALTYGINKDVYDLELRRQIASIASSFQIFECVQCADAIKSFLSEQGICGKQIKLFTGSTEEPFCNIYHEILNQNISTNGRHEAIVLEIEGKELVFDNIHPQGVLRVDWINNLYCPIKDIGGDFQITEIDF